MQKLKKGKSITERISSGGRIFTGIAGEYFVAGELSRRGLVATITSKNTKNVDILVSDVEGKKFAYVQVKSGKSSSGGFIVGASGKQPIKNLGSRFFYVFVYFSDKSSPDYWIIPQNLVARVANKHYLEFQRRRKTEKSWTAPRIFSWDWLKSEKGKIYHNNWKILGL